MGKTINKILLGEVNMKDLIEALKGKKTYIVVTGAIILGVLQGLGIFTLPPEGWTIIVALGGGAMAAKANRIAEAIKNGEGGGE
jgi:hypothetical protein